MTRIVVYHSSYGCETGCCGHVVESDEEQDFSFSHPYGTGHRAFAEELIRDKFGPEHVADLDWDACLISED